MKKLINLLTDIRLWFCVLVSELVFNDVASCCNQININSNKYTLDCGVPSSMRLPSESSYRMQSLFACDCSLKLLNIGIIH